MLFQVATSSQKYVTYTHNCNINLTDIFGVRLMTKFKLLKIKLSLWNLILFEDFLIDLDDRWLISLYKLY